jgi:uncharacterized protein (TIGR02099 family)
MGQTVCTGGGLAVIILKNLFTMPSLSDAPVVAARPTRGWRVYAGLVRLLWWSVVSLWGLVALAALTLHFWIAPRVLDWRGDIEAMASQALGVKVSIGNLATISSDWLPSLEITDFVLRNAAGEEVLRLPRVLVSLSPTSLLTLSLDRVDIDGPSIEVTRDSDGLVRIAGLSLSDAQPSALGDWFWSQPAIFVHHGHVRWIDYIESLPPVELQEVNMVLRNGLRSHAWRVDASPPAAWGERFSLQGQFQQALLSRHAGDVKTWNGQVYAAFSHIDVAALQPYAKAWLGDSLQTGHGWLRWWAQVHQGQLTAQTVDMDMQSLRWHDGQAQQAVVLRSLKGRLAHQAWRDAVGHDVRSQGAQLSWEDGEQWSLGNSRLAWRDEGPLMADAGELQLEAFSLDTLSRIAQRLPLNETWLNRLAVAQAKGHVKQLDVQWSAAHSDAPQFSLKTDIHDLSLQASSNSPKPDPRVWWPGLQSSALRIELSEHGGKALWHQEGGRLQLSGLWEGTGLALQEASLDVGWERKDSQWVVRVHQAKLSNADMQAQAQAHWQSGDSTQPLGSLDLQAKVDRLEATSLHRYLPLSMDEQARHYVRDALLAGRIHQAAITLKGPLDRFPFARNNEGVFTVRAPFQQLSMQVAPSSTLSAAQRRDKLAWPIVQQAWGEFNINRNRLQVKGASARWGLDGSTTVSKLDVQIADLRDIVVDVNAQLRGNLSDTLQMVKTSPLNNLTDQALAQVSATGIAEQQLHLNVPLQNPALTKVQGSVQFNGNELQWQPTLPRFGKLRGTLNYSESGVSVNNMRLRWLGGDARLDGGLRFNDSTDAGPTRLSLQGSVTAEALRQITEPAWVAGVAAHLSGSTAFVASLGLRRGEPEFSFISSMQGMGVDLPEPLKKPADAQWPVRFDSELLRVSQARGSAHLEQSTLTMGQLINISYVRDMTPQVPQVLRGHIVLGAVSSRKEVADGTVLMQVQLPHFNADVWQQTLATWLGTDSSDDKPAKLTSAQAMAYVPKRFEVGTGELLWLGRSFNHVQASADKMGPQWRIQLKADEAQGLVDYWPTQEGQSGRVVARLSNLVIPPSAVQDVESSLSDSPKDLPAMDIVIDNLELRGLKLGRAEIDGFSRGIAGGGREWVLHKFNLTLPEASFQAKGQWGGVGRLQAKRTQLDFTLQLQNSGELLERLGYKGAIRNGKGRMAGQVGWMGSPFSPDYASMTGQFNVNIDKGQFLKADPGVARLFGVLNLQALPRRLTLDFSDVFSEGFAFDFVRGDVQIQQGIASTNNLQMKGVTAAVMLEGKADIEHETQDLKVVVIPDLNTGTATLLYTIINPVVGLTSFLAQYFLKTPLAKSTTQEFRVQGAWKDPKVSKVDGNTQKEVKP